MSLVIEIDSNEVKTRSGTSAKTGKDYNIREQTAYAHIPGQRYPQQIKLMLEDNQMPYPVGKYQLDPSSFYVGRFDDLQIRVKLANLPASGSKPQAVGSN